MHKVNVSIPAVSTNVGPGLDVLGLALNLRNIIELSLAPGEELKVEMHGEGEEVLPDGFYNPVMRAATRLFQRLEQAPVGLNVRVTNHIPLDVGLSARTTLIVGGMVGANNLLGSPFSHEQLIEMASELSGQPEAVVTAMRGGLGLCSQAPGGPLLYRAIEISPLRVVVSVPNLPNYKPPLRADLSATVPLADAIQNMGHTALVIEALRSGDFDLLRHALRDKLHEPQRVNFIQGFEAVQQAALDAGAIGMTLCGAGPALMAFATYNHQSIETAIQGAFRAVGVEARTWSLGVDQQGIVLSVVE